MTKIKIPAAAFENEEAFHLAFALAMGFPAFYGKNWDAWIDCMSYIADPKAGMSKVTVPEGESLEIEVLASGGRYYEEKTFGDFCSCMGAVNARFEGNGSATRLILLEKAAR